MLPHATSLEELAEIFQWLAQSGADVICVFSLRCLWHYSLHCAWDSAQDAEVAAELQKSIFVGDCYVLGSFAGLRYREFW